MAVRKAEARHLTESAAAGGPRRALRVGGGGAEIGPRKKPPREMGLLPVPCVGANC